jgi:hypothetical protein
MYQVHYYDTATGRLSKPIFNSIDAAHKFVQEKINREDIQEYIRHLHNCRKLYALNYAKPESQLTDIFGDVGIGFPTLLSLRLLVHRSGFYEYRIGNADTNSRSIHFKIISISIDDIRESVCADQAKKLHDASVKIDKLFSNEYSRAYHE